MMPAHLLEAKWKAGNYNHMWGINTAPDSSSATARTK